jgi:hypothetical protein
MARGREVARLFELTEELLKESDGNRKESDGNRTDRRVDRRFRETHTKK